MGSMVNEFHTKRVLELINEEHKASRVLFGNDGEIDPKNKYIPMTVIDEPSLDSELMKQEIFGPVLPIIKFTEIDEAI